MPLANNQKHYQLDLIRVKYEQLLFDTRRISWEHIDALKYRADVLARTMHKEAHAIRLRQKAIEKRLMRWSARIAALRAAVDCGTLVTRGDIRALEKFILQRRAKHRQRISRMRKRRREIARANQTTQFGTQLAEQIRTFAERGSKDQTASTVPAATHADGA